MEKKQEKQWEAEKTDEKKLNTLILIERTPASGI